MIDFPYLQRTMQASHVDMFTTFNNNIHANKNILYEYGQ